MRASADSGDGAADLPEGWALAPLSELTVPVPNIRPEDAPGHSFCYVDISAIDNQLNVVRSEEIKRFKGIDAPSRARREVRPGDVLFSNVRTNLRNIAILHDGIDANVCSTGFTVLRSSGAVESTYLFRSVLTDAFIDAVSGQQTGTHYPATSDRVILAQAIAVPPLAEQQRILAVLESLLADATVIRQRFAKVPGILKRFRQAVIAKAASGLLTAEWREAQPDNNGSPPACDEDLELDGLPELPTSWTYRRADAIVDPGTVISYGIVLPGPEIPAGVPYVRQQDIEDGYVNVTELRHTSPEIAAKHSRSVLRAGDVLLCIIRNLRVAIVPAGLDGANITQGTVRLRPSKDISAAYLARYLASPYAQGWMKRRYIGMSMPRINVEHARAIPIALPPLEEQHEIVRRVDALFALADVIEKRVAAAIARADKVPQAILAKAFRGELVPTEAELARREGRDYEPASALLERIRRERAAAPAPAPRRRRAR